MREQEIFPPRNFPPSGDSALSSGVSGSSSFLVLNGCNKLMRVNCT